MRRKLKAHVRHHMVGYLALFVALGGTAYAANEWTGENIVDESLTGADIREKSIGATDLALESVPTGRLALNAVRSDRVRDNSLTGLDIDESQLGDVPTALLGGIGRWESKSGEACDVGGDFFTCAFTTINLPRKTRYLLIGTAKVQVPWYSPRSSGHCLLASHLVHFQDTVTGFTLPSGTEDHITLVAAGTHLPGPVDFAIRCRQLSGDIVVWDAAIAAVALSPN